ncbi:MAG: hypothetical protein LBC97_09845 [Bifidobacteriaceae bacterium]|jgi:hypothetical protein|nr:hypothetical protein [Bifidobacteriaceae bacterium]
MTDFLAGAPTNFPVPAKPAGPPPGYYMALDGSIHPEPDMSTDSRFGGSGGSAPKAAGLANPVPYDYKFQRQARRQGMGMVGILLTALIVVVIGMLAVKVVQDRTAAADPDTTVSAPWANPVPDGTMAWADLAGTATVRVPAGASAS